MSNPYGYDPNLPNGAEVLFIPAINPIGTFDASWDGTTLTCASMSDRCSITVRRPEDLPASARLAGERLSGASSLGLALMLLFVAHHEAIPSPHFRQELHVLTGLVLMIRNRSIDRNAPVLDDALIEQQARERMEASQRDEMRRLDVPEGPWNAARTLFAYGAAAWQLRGRDAWIWFTLPLFVNGEQMRDKPGGVVPLDNRQIVWRSAGVALTNQLREQLPVRFPADRAPISTLTAWQSVAPGAAHLVDIVRAAMAVPPVGHRTLNAPTGTLDLARTFIPPEDSDKPIPVLTTSARRIVRSLLRTDRPYPRFLDRLLEVDIPVDAVPELADWFAKEVSALWLIPTSQGLWVALRDQRADRAWFWWQPSMEQGDRFIMSANPRVWPATHLLLCTLWHDLCAEAEVISEAPAGSTTPASKSTGPDGQPKGRLRGRAVGPAIVTLPPHTSPTHVQWASPEERKAIRSTTRRGHAYRRLPEGWEDLAQQSAPPTKAQRGYQQRREAAIARAEEYGQEPPPIGYTYVRPYGQIDTIGPLQPRVRVRPRGLFTLALELPVIGQEIADATEGD